MAQPILHMTASTLGMIALFATHAIADPPRTPAAPAAPEGSIVLDQHTLHDPSSNNMPSHTLLAPAGWNVDGSAYWANAQFFNIHPSQNVKITSPDGVQLHIGPSISAYDYLPSPEAMHYGAQRPREGTANNGLIVLHMPSNLQQWSQYFEQKLLPQEYADAKNIRVDEVVIVPEFTQLIQQQLMPTRQQAAQMNQQSQAMGVPMHSHVDGAMLAVSSTYTIGDQKWEELHLFGTMFYLTDSQSGREIHWGVEPNISFRAPAGQLESNLPLLMAIANSFQPTPQWARMKSEHLAKMNQIAVEGAAKRSAIIADSHREVSRIINDGWEQRQASMDRTHRKTANAIRGVDDFVHPDGSTPVQLPHNYQHVYTNGSQYILTNDPNYDPNRDAAINNQNWDRMKRANP